MAIELVRGNIFNTKAQVVVNTVNCVGVMGKGIALVYKLRYPKMFDLYQEHCKSKLIGIGKLWLYKGEPDAPWVLNFPTKFHWKYPSKLEYVEKGLQKVYQLMTSYLSKCEIPVEIYEYDPSAPDDLFESFAVKWGSFSSAQIQKVTGIRKDRINTISTVIESKSIKSMIDLINEPGIGLVTMEKCYSFIMRSESQKSLFD